jgi:hypothetical protein
VFAGTANHQEFLRHVVSSVAGGAALEQMIDSTGNARPVPRVRSARQAHGRERCACGARRAPPYTRTSRTGQGA